MQGDIAGWYKYEEEQYPIKETANGSYMAKIGKRTQWFNKELNPVPIEKDRDVLDKEEHILGELISDIFNSYDYNCTNEYDKDKQISGIDAYIDIDGNTIPFDNKASLTYNGANLMTFQMEISATGRGNTPNYTNTYFNHDKGSQYTNIIFPCNAKTFISTKEDIGQFEMYLVRNSDLEVIIETKYNTNTENIIKASKAAYNKGKWIKSGDLYVQYWNTPSGQSTTIQIKKEYIEEIAILSYKDGKITKKMQESI